MSDVLAFGRYSKIIIFLVLVIIGSIAYYPSFDASLSVEDEYLFVANCGHTVSGLSQSNAFHDFISFQNYFINFGRFAPLTIASYFVKARVLGVNPFYLHLSVFCTVLLTSFLLSRVLSFFVGWGYITLLTALFYLTLPECSEIAYRLCSGEALGNLFLFLSLNIIIQGVFKNKFHTAWLLISNLMMSFCKENYLLMVPVLALTDSWLHSRFRGLPLISTLKKNISHLFIAYFIPSLITVSGIAWAIHSRGLVFDYGSPLSVYMIVLNNYWWWTKWLIPYAPVILLSLALLWNKSKPSFFLPAIMIALCWIGLQSLAYHKILVSYSQGRYHMPAIIPLFFGIAYLVFVISAFHRKLFYLSLVFSFLLVINQAKSSFIRAGAYTSKANNFHVQIDYIRRNAPAFFAVYGGFEYLYSLQHYLHFYEVKSKMVYVKPIKDSSATVKLKNEKFDNMLLGLLKKDFKVIEFKEFCADSSLTIMLSGFESGPGEFVNLAEISKPFKEVVKTPNEYFNASWKDIISGNFNKRSAVSFYIFKR